MSDGLDAFTDPYSIICDHGPQWTEFLTIADTGVPAPQSFHTYIGIDRNEQIILKAGCELVDSGRASDVAVALRNNLGRILSPPVQSRTYPTAFEIEILKRPINLALLLLDLQRENFYQFLEREGIQRAKLKRAITEVGIKPPYNEEAVIEISNARDLLRGYALHFSPAAPTNETNSKLEEVMKKATAPVFAIVQKYPTLATIDLDSPALLDFLLHAYKIVMNHCQPEYIWKDGLKNYCSTALSLKRPKPSGHLTFCNAVEAAVSYAINEGFFETIQRYQGNIEIRPTPKGWKQLTLASSVEVADDLRRFVKHVKNYQKWEHAAQLSEKVCSENIKRRIDDGGQLASMILDAQQRRSGERNEIVSLSKTLGPKLSTLGYDSEPLHKIAQFVDPGGGGPKEVAKVWPDIRSQLLAWADELQANPESGHSAGNRHKQMTSIDASESPLENGENVSVIPERRIESPTALPEYESIPEGVRIKWNGEQRDVAGQPGTVLRIAIALNKPAEWRHVQEAWSKEKLGEAPSAETLKKYGQRARRTLNEWKELLKVSSFGCEWRPLALTKKSAQNPSKSL